MIGTLSDRMIDVILETMPVELSVIDANDKLVGWNKHESRVFKRPENVLGKDVRLCHPKRSLAKVEKLLDEMKAGTRDSARFWINFPVGHEKRMEKILIEYFALRDNDGGYIGCLEATRNIQSIIGIAGEKRLID